MPKPLQRPAPQDILDFCDRHSISKYRLAQIMRVNTSTLQHWTRGTSPVPAWVGKMLELLDILGVTSPQNKTYTEQDVRAILDNVDDDIWRMIMELRLDTPSYGNLGVLISIDDDDKLNYVNLLHITDIRDCYDMYMIAFLGPMDIWQICPYNVHKDSQGHYYQKKKRAKKIRDISEVVNIFLSSRYWRIYTQVVEIEIMNQFNAMPEREMNKKSLKSKCVGWDDLCAQITLAYPCIHHNYPRRVSVCFGAYGIGAVV